MAAIQAHHIQKIYETPVRSGKMWKDLFTRSYKKHNAISDVSFNIDKGEFVGLVGPNGAGKTTLMKMLSGILYPTSGTIEVLGFTPFEKKTAYLKKIAFIMGQRYQLMWDLPAIDSFSVNKAVYEIPDAQYNKSLNELVELLDAKELIEKPVKMLSLGQRMRVEFIGSLLHHPEVLFLDEPTIGLDVVAQSAIVGFLKEYQRRYKPVILFTSHYMRDVERLADRVLLIQSGDIVFDGTLSALLASYSSTKKIAVTLQKKLDEATLQKVKTFGKATYSFPLLTVTVQKEDLHKALDWILSNCPYTDVDIQGEPIEDTIERLFRRKKV